MNEATGYPAQLRGGIFDGDEDDIGLWPPEIWAYTCLHNPPCRNVNGIHWAHNQNPESLVTARRTAARLGGQLEIYARHHLENGTMIYTWKPVMDRRDQEERELVPAGHDLMPRPTWDLRGPVLVCVSLCG